MNGRHLLLVLLAVHLSGCARECKPTPISRKATARENKCTPQQIAGGYEDVDGECLLTGWNWGTGGGTGWIGGCRTRRCGDGQGPGGTQPDPLPPPQDCKGCLDKCIPSTERCYGRCPPMSGCGLRNPQCVAGVETCEDRCHNASLLCIDNCLQVLTTEQAGQCYSEWMMQFAPHRKRR